MKEKLKALLIKWNLYPPLIKMGGVYRTREGGKAFVYGSNEERYYRHSPYRVRVYPPNNGESYDSNCNKYGRACTLTNDLYVSDILDFTDLRDVK